MCAHVKMQCNAYLFDAQPKSMCAYVKINVMLRFFMPRQKLCFFENKLGLS